MGFAGAAGFASAGVAPNIIAERGPSSLAAGFAKAGFETAGIAGFGNTGDWPNTMVAPESGSAALAAGFAAGAGLAPAAGGWPPAMTAPAAGSGFAFAPGDGLRFPVWNIMVRPAPSSVGAATGAAGFAAAGAAVLAAGGFAVAGMAGFEGGTGDCPNTMVALDAGPAGWAAGFAGAGFGAGAGGIGAWSGTVGSDSPLVTLNVFWHFPQRIVRPWGPIRASSTR
jgi:hypothetical protein